jgi:outer membrane protein OmpA-like peptidoglycan-associated protein
VSALGFVASIALTACASTAVVAPARVSPAASSQLRPRAADTDGDGIADPDDRCPDTPETRNGYQDDDGCPDLAPLPPASPSDVGRIAERIGFPHDSAELKPATSPMLDAIAVVLKTQPQQFPLVALEGHAADNEHTPMRLSLARASAVRVALLGRGVDPARLLARASGAMAPACVQQNETCRASERSVELITLPGAKPAAAPPPPETADAAAPTPNDKPAGAGDAPAPAPLERIEFSKGSAVLAPSALANLDLLAGFMKANAASMEIVGYADERERGAATLAQARADAVRGYMMACGVSGAHLVTRAERTGRADCRSHSAKCPARSSRAELRFVEPAATPAAPAGDAAPARHP